MDSKFSLILDDLAQAPSLLAAGILVAGLILLPFLPGWASLPLAIVLGGFGAPMCIGFNIIDGIRMFTRGKTLCIIAHVIAVGALLVPFGLFVLICYSFFTD